jgi:hypothetical protein
MCKMADTAFRARYPYPFCWMLFSWYAASIANAWRQIGVRSSMSESPANNMIGARSGETPDLIEPVIGYRMWAVEDGELVAPFQREFDGDEVRRRYWGAGVHQAECRPTRLTDRWRAGSTP